MLFRSMLVERPIIGRFAGRWPELKDSRDIVEWTYDVSLNSDSSFKAWSLHSSLHKNTIESRYLVTLGRCIISGRTRWALFSRSMESGVTYLYIENGLKMFFLEAGRLLTRPIFMTQF